MTPPNKLYKLLYYVSLCSFLLTSCFYYYKKPETKNLPFYELADYSEFLKPIKEKLSTGKSQLWQYIVIHHSATDSGNALEFDKYHKQKGWDGLGYHFVIGNGKGSGDGEIEVGYRWLQQSQGAHAGNYFYNQYGIGICLVGNFEFYNPTQKQMQSLSDLMKFLMKRFEIEKNCITLHKYVRDIERGETLCPGKHLTLEKILNHLKNN